MIQNIIPQNREKFNPYVFSKKYFYVTFKKSNIAKADLLKIGSLLCIVHCFIFITIFCGKYNISIHFQMFQSLHNRPLLIRRTLRLLRTVRLSLIIIFPLNNSALLLHLSNVQRRYRKSRLVL